VHPASILPTEKSLAVVIGLIVKLRIRQRPNATGTIDVLGNQVVSLAESRPRRLKEEFDTGSDNVGERLVERAGFAFINQLRGIVGEPVG
jgi:hypothetical protein